MLKISNRIIDKQEEQKEMLDGIGYLAKRLDWDQDFKENALKNWPSLTKTNMSRVRLVAAYCSRLYHFM